MSVKKIFPVLLLLFMAGVCLAQTATDDPSVNGPVSQADVEKLKHEIAEEDTSDIEPIFEYHSESGDLNNRLDYWRYGGRLDLKVGSGSAFFVSGTRSQYLTRSSLFDGAGTNFTGGLRTQLSDTTTFRVEGGATRFSTGATTVNAAGGLTYKASDKAALYVKGSRSNVEESLLSATGVRPVVGPFAGKLVGEVMDNRVLGGAGYTLFQNFDVFAEGGLGTRTGLNIQSNPFRTARAGAGYNLLTQAPDDEGMTLLRASYEMNYFGFDHDLFGFGGASLETASGQPVAPALLGGDLISPVASAGNPGLGGYFSPQYYLSNTGRLEVRGNDGALHYALSGFLGAQTYTGTSNKLVAGVSATVRLALSDSISLPITYALDNYGPFTQQTVQLRLLFKF